MTLTAFLSPPNRKVQASAKEGELKVYLNPKHKKLRSCLIPSFPLSLACTVCVLHHMTMSQVCLALVSMIRTRRRCRGWVEIWDGPSILLTDARKTLMEQIWGCGFMLLVPR